jgi:hypothetical protein
MLHELCHSAQEKIIGTGDLQQWTDDVTDKLAELGWQAPYNERRGLVVLMIEGQANLAEFEIGLQSDHTDPQMVAALNGAMTVISMHEPADWCELLTTDQGIDDAAAMIATQLASQQAK